MGMQPKEFFEKLKPEMERITAQYERRQAALLPLLNFAQEQCGHVGTEIEEGIGAYLEIPVVHVREVVTFYTLLRREPPAQHHFQVCDTLSCDLLGCENVVEHLKKRLGIEPGQKTADGKFALSKVECLGACELAPMMQWNEDYVGHLTPEKVDEILEKLSSQPKRE